MPGAVVCRLEVKSEKNRYQTEAEPVSLPRPRGRNWCAGRGGAEGAFHQDRLRREEIQAREPQGPRRAGRSPGGDHPR